MKLTAAILALITATAFAQGPLAPPGAPAPTMKTLDEIHTKVAESGEKRTPISAIPFAITQPGSYYLTGNLSTALAVDGISIDAKNVTIDLNGFRMTGFGAGLVAIKMTNASVNTQTMVVKNGVIDGFATAIGGVSSSVNAASIENVHIQGGDGIQLREANNARIHGCVLQDSVVTSGILNVFGAISAGRGAVVTECRVAAATGSVYGVAIYAYENGVVRDSTVTDTGVSGIFCGPHGTVSNCAVTGTGSTGISVSTGVVDGCSVKGIFDTGIAATGTIHRCSVSLSGTTVYGIRFFGGKISDCSVDGITGTGVWAEQACIVEGTTVAEFDTGIYSLGANTVRGCEVQNCDTGIRMGSRGTAFGNSIIGESSAAPARTGILVTSTDNTLDGNRLTNCATGISITGTGNIIHRNSLRNNTTPLSIVGGNEAGPTGTPSTATSPFANLVY